MVMDIFCFQIFTKQKPKVTDQQDDTARTAIPGPAYEEKRVGLARIPLDTVPVKIIQAPVQKKNSKKRPEKNSKKTTVKNAPADKKTTVKDNKMEALESKYIIATMPVDKMVMEYDNGLALLKKDLEKGKKKMNEVKKAYPQLNDTCNRAISDAYAEEGFRYIISGFEDHSLLDTHPGIYDRGQDMLEHAEAAFHKAVSYYGSSKEGIKARLRKLVEEDIAFWAPLVDKHMEGTEMGRGYMKSVQKLIDRISGFK